MSNYDTNILIQNIKRLMRDKNVSQQKLAEILEMSQPNVSKALNENNKKCFTLIQVIGIADFFQVSVDELIHNRKSISVSTNPRDVARFLATLLENGDAKIIKHSVKEEVFIEKQYDLWFQYEPSEQIVNYNAFYLPSYWQVPSNVYSQEDNYLQREAAQVGNDTSMKTVNTFISHFTGILEAYKNGSLTEETYRTVLEDLLSHLRD